jgi:transposase
MGYKRYPVEFMDEAVKLCLADGADRTEIANNLGVKYKTLSNWISKAMSKSPKDVKIDYQSHYQQLLTENNELKKKLKKTEVEREILKKAAAYFASQSQ